MVAATGGPPPATSVAAVLAGLLACPAPHAAAADLCDCLSWKQVYQSQRVICGEGPEFFTLGGRTAHDFKEISDFKTKGGSIYYEYCRTFFMVLDDNMCVNLGQYPRGMTEWFAGSWCYVDSRCQRLNGGARIDPKRAVVSWWPKWPALLHSWGPTTDVPRGVSWKVCEPGKDRSLRDLAPDLVLAMADQQSSIKGLMVKMAYTRLMPEIWGDVEEQWIANDTKSMPTMLQEAIAAKEPIVIDVDPDGHGDQKIMWGDDLYSLDNMGPIVCGSTFFCHRREKRGEL